MNRPSLRGRPRAALALLLPAALLALVPSPAPAAPAEPAPSPVPTTRVEVADLPRGAAPRVDVLVGRRLVHDGRTTTVRVPARTTPRVALGTWRGVPLVVATRPDGDQLYAVARDGRVTARGPVFQTYNYPPVLVRTSGHVLTALADRSGPTTYTVLDASTGRVVVETTDPDDLDPADRAVLQRWQSPPRWVTARSASGRHDVVARDPDGARPAQLTVRRTEGTIALRRFAFAPYASTRTSEWPDSVDAAQVRMERGSTLLAVGLDRSGERMTVVRCRVGGRCERAMPWATLVSVAGAGALGWTGAS
ncbi:hypothetical protein [Nocardioides litoris]|uniref:hypothetical protein n=1 Tax=Nocardioides litoris TaxID=1926648 RepID=UPI00112324F8|nr:hypothetical protein [Nocardioides litoris]